MSLVMSTTTSLLRYLFRLCGWLGVAILFAAGFTKFIDLSNFELSLKGWTVIAYSWQRTLIAFLVPSLEVLPLFLALAGRCRLGWFLGVCTSGLLMVGVVAQRLAGDVPECKCFGILTAKFDVDRSFGLHISILLVIVALHVLGIWADRHASPRKPWVRTNG